MSTISNPALNSKQIQKIVGRLDLMHRVLSQLDWWTTSGRFNFVAFAPASKLICPVRGETGETGYDVRKNLSNYVYPVKRLTEANTLLLVCKKVLAGYILTNDQEELKQLAGQKGEVGD